MREQQEKTPHHIANIAHLFFAEDAVAPEGGERPLAESDVVVSFSKFDLAEYVCQQMNRESGSNSWQSSDGFSLQRPEHGRECALRNELILCLLESEIDDCEVALKAGRVLGILDPLHLQVLVFSGENVTASTPSGSPSQMALLKWCGQLTRSLAGRCPVTVTMMPGCPGENSLAVSDPILKSIAKRTSF